MNDPVTQERVGQNARALHFDQVGGMTDIG
jgi:hypothetical protein